MPDQNRKMKGKERRTNPVSSFLLLTGQSVKMSLENVMANKMRSFLTMLGIMIGVASVIGLITIVSGATSSIMSDMMGLGANSLQLSAQGTDIHPGLLEDDMDQLRKIKGVTAVSPSVSTTTDTVFNGEIAENTLVNGTDPIYFKSAQVELLSGRIFGDSDSDGNTNVAVVDKTFVQKALSGHGKIGTKFLLDGYEYQLIGIMKPKDSMTQDTWNNTGTVYVPYKNVLRMMNKYYVSGADIYYDSSIDASVIEQQVRNRLDNIFSHKKGAYTIFNMQSLQEMMQQTEQTLSLMLGGIASIALLVGGIGIMNMMLVSVTERTREIGLRKALGAEPSRIQLQFLSESVILSLTGGAIGIVIGLLIAFIGSKALKTAFQISYPAILIGAGFSIAVGIIFGWMPARRASRLNPIDALRSE